MATRIESLREAARRERDAAARAYATSEYPGLGRSAHTEYANALEALAEVLGEIGEEPPHGAATHYEARRAKRVYWLKRKAAEKSVEAASLRARSHDMGSARPLGQPLVGSPARQRRQARAIERVVRTDERAWEASKEAHELERRAHAAECNRSISSDDPRAIEKLRDKLAKLEARRDAARKQRKRATVPLLNYRAPEGIEVRNSMVAGETYTLGQVEMTRAEYKRLRGEQKGTCVAANGTHRVRYQFRALKSSAVFITDSKAHPVPPADANVEECPTPPRYAMDNLGAQIRSVRQRIEELEKRDEIEERAPRRIGDVEVLDNLDFHKVELHFPGKPKADTRELLRRCGFRWVRSAGCWSRGIGAETEARLDMIARHLGEELI